MDRMASSLSWHLGPSSGPASWTLDSSLTLILLKELFSAAAPPWQPLPEERHAACAAACDSKHALSWQLPSGEAFFAGVPVVEEAEPLEFPLAPDSPLVVRVGMRRGGSGFVRWESPLVALQRAEGIIVVEATEAEGVTWAWRLAPVTAQSTIASLVSWASAHGAATGAAAAHATAERDLAAYASATAALASQVARVRGGGEEWTIEERLAKLSKLQQLAGPALHKAEHGEALSDAERAVLEALAAGRAEFSAELDEAGGEDGAEATATPAA